MENVRIDKWLWTVRLFKTRSMATDACNAGKVKMNGTNVKPSKNIKADEVFEVHIGQLVKTVKVLDAPKSRVGAPLVPQYCEDLTPPEEYERVRMLNMRSLFREGYCFLSSLWHRFVVYRWQDKACLPFLSLLHVLLLLIGYSCGHQILIRLTRFPSQGY